MVRFPSVSGGIAVAGRTAWKRAAAACGVISIALLLAGCAGGDRTVDGRDGHEPKPASASRTYLCARHEFPASVVEMPKRIADLDDAARAAIATATDDIGKPVPLGDTGSWIVVSQDDERISLLRPNAEPVETGALLPGSGPDAPDYEELTLFSVDDRAWKFGSNGHCRLTVDQGGLQVPEVALDPAFRPASEDRELHLLVLDPECGGDTDLPGRIEAEVDESGDEVKLSLAVHPLPAGAYTCEGSPPTPYTVKLERALGDRLIIDASRVHPYRLPIDGARRTG